MKRISITTTIVLLALAVWQVTNARSLSQPSPDAIEIVRTFTERSDLRLVELPAASSPSGVIERTFTTPDEDAIFTVDEQRREVTTAVFSIDRTRTQSVALTRDQAFAVAQTFLQSRVRGAERLSLLSEQSYDHGAGGMVYRFEWGERLGTQQALGLHRIAISVDVSTGAVVNYMRVPPQTITVNVEPTISATQAQDIAMRAFGAPVVHSSTKLDIWWRNNDRSQPQILRWTVILEEADPRNTSTSSARRAGYIIDAHTGTILETLR